jgi:glycine/D-amino acid oxidase-like deaminating enzyme
MTSRRRVRCLSSPFYSSLRQFQPSVLAVSSRQLYPSRTAPISTTSVVSVRRATPSSTRGNSNTTTAAATNNNKASSQLPKSAQTVIIGGGCIGCAVAYSLAKAGQKDIVLVEKESAIASVTTAQAAGLVGQVRNDLERVQLAMWSVQTFSDLQNAEADYTPNWRQVGSLRVAHTEERVQEFKRMEAVCKKAGLNVQALSPSEAAKKWPGMDFSNTKRILWCPTDGYLQPADLSNAYQYHSKRIADVKFVTDCSVHEIILDAKGQHVRGVGTSKGRIECERVVNAAGAHAYHIARLVGLELPIVPVRHEYFITQPLPNKGILPHFPVIRIPDETLYLRADVHSLLLGGWEPEGLSLDPRSYDITQKPPPIQEDWQVLSTFGEKLSKQYPMVNEVGVRAVFSGWPTFTPDGRFIVGPTKKVGGFIMAGGCNAHGVSGSAGIGRHVVESILDRSPSPYVRSLSPDRFLEGSWDWPTAERTARRVYETYYVVRP